MKNLNKIATNPIKKDYDLSADQLQNILKLMRALNNVSSDTKLIQKMSAAVEEILSIKKCIVWLYDSMEKSLWSYIKNKKISAGIDDCLAGKALQEMQFIHLANPGSAELFNDYTDSIEGASTGHILCFPFRQKGGAEGVMQLMNTSVHQITPHTINVINEWSDMAAGIFSNVIRVEDFKKCFDTFIDMMSHALDTRDFIAAGHSRRVTLYTVEVAKQMGLSAMDTEVLRYAGLLHDIGKIGIPELILLKDKKPNDDEFEIIKRHVGLTKNMLSKVHLPGELKNIVDMAATHHERLDGKGYPLGLKGDQIPRGGKILAVCDVFDALTSRRTYQDRLPVQKVINILDDEVNESFEPFVVYHFKNITLDRVIQIMEYGHSAHMNDEDIEYLKNFTLNNLVTTDKIRTDEQQKMETTFDKYYSRHYRS